MNKKLKTGLIITVIALLVLGSVTFCVVIPIVGKNIMLHPKHEPMYIYPHELNMTYQNVTITTTDELELKGWYVEPKNSTHPNAEITMVVLHGASHSKAWMLDHYGEGFYNQGYRLLFIDSRNRGESPDTAAGVTWGIEEVKDIRATVDYLKSKPEVNDSQIVLFAESQGSATVAFYAAMYNDVAAIVVDSIWAYGDAMIKRAYPQRAGFPWFIIGQITIRMLERHYGFSFADISPAKVANNITTPTFIIQSEEDTDFDYNDAILLNNTIPNTTPKELWLVKNRGHVEAYLEVNYFTKISNFLVGNI